MPAKAGLVLWRELGPVPVILANPFHVCTRNTRSEFRDPRRACGSIQDLPPDIDYTVITVVRPTTTPEDLGHNERTKRNTCDATLGVQSASHRFSIYSTAIICHI